MISYPNVKVNLGLNVLRRRPDGYHDLETLFVPYHEIHDVLEVISGDDYSRTSASLFARYGGAPGQKDGEGTRMLSQAVSPDGKMMITVARKEGVDWDPLKDLCARAYAVLDADFGLPPVKIFLEKLSPVGAGLGGGSADAAFTLRMLEKMFSLGLDDGTLAGYASRLGSDCAFFIYDRPMFGEGRGEILSEFHFSDMRLNCGVESGYSGAGNAKEYELKVVVPEGISVSTADAYKGICPCMPEVPLKEVLSMPVEQWRGFLRNDFEPAVFRKYPQLEAIKESLYGSGAVYAAMSGSGSALFAIYEK